MGDYAYLRLGELEIDWGKNDYFVDYSALFQRSDLWRKEERYLEDDEELEAGEEVQIVVKEGYRKPLEAVLSRLELLGCTSHRVRQLLDEILADYVIVCDESGEPDGPLVKITAEDVVGYFSRINAAAAEVRDKTIWDLIEEQVAQQFAEASSHTIDGFIEDSLSGLGGAACLVLLSQNPANAGLSVTWDFGDIVEGGYVDREAFVHDLDRRLRVLLVTEGSTDVRILDKALTLRRPEIADFFYFINVGEGYPFSGTGSLFNFCRGLIAIGVLNHTIVIYDNDAEGHSKLELSRQLTIPQNMRVMSLPDIVHGNLMNCIGPEGAVMADINGRAAAIECYLDLNLDGREPLIRWTNYLQAVAAYQGSLLDKDAFTRAFLHLRDPSRYDFRKLEQCLDAITAAAVAMAEVCMGTINPVRSYRGRSEFW